MSILIKGMEMPKGCLMCPFHGFGDYKNESIVCALTGRSEPQLSNVLGCPLIEVPPHGRLIDADALPHYTGYALSANEVAKAVEAAPTIIEAEEGADHE